MRLNWKSLCIALVPLLLSVSCATVPSNATQSESTDVNKRIFAPNINGEWVGNGISYSAYRDGEGPDQGGITSKAHILEDLKLLSKRWKLIRMYGADAQSRNVLEVIRDNNLPIKVMQGAWISGHQTAQENNQQIEQVIDLANKFGDIVVAVNVGNEIFVDWSWHKVGDMDEVISDIRKVRANIRQPVTVNDDYNFWNKPHSEKIAREVDFIGLHAYAFWNNKTIDEAMDWTQSIYQDIQQRHPHHLIAYTETGWPTSRVYDDSYEGQLIGRANEINQQKFFQQYDAWVNQNKIISLYFSAFDEKWKGGFDGENPMDKAEKHWGIYYSDRSPKSSLK